MRHSLIALGAFLGLVVAPVGVALRDGPASPSEPLAVTRSPDAQALDGYFPDVALRADDGSTLRFYTDCLRGKVVLLNFIFTRCGSYCPRATDNLVRVQRKLGDRAGRDVFLYSLTVDPENDSPEVLRAFAQKHGVGPDWRFLTGAPADLDKIRERFGSFEKVKMNHTGLLIIGDEQAGRWISIPAIADPDEIVAAIDRLRER